MKMIQIFFKPYLDKIKWIVYSAKYHVGADEEILILADNDDELNNYAIMHLEEYVQKRRIKSVVLITTKSFEVKDINRKSYIKKVYYDETAIGKLIKLRYVTDKIVVISLNDSPINRNKNLIGLNGTTKEDIVCYCYYALFSYKKR